MLAAAEEKHGLTFRLGQEVEFYLLRPGLMEDASRRGLPEPVDTSVYCQTGAFDNVAAGKPLSHWPQCVHMKPSAWRRTGADSLA